MHTIFVERVFLFSIGVTAEAQLVFLFSQDVSFAFLFVMSTLVFCSFADPFVLLSYVIYCYFHMQEDGGWAVWLLQSCFRMLSFVCFFYLIKFYD